jgi:hypothetical protein
VLMDIALASAVFSCEFASTDDWEWWNENIPGKLGNCTLNNGPGIDAAMRIESKIATCTPATACTYFTNVVWLPRDAVGEGVATNDPTALNDNLFDYKIFINTTSKPNYHTCLSDLEMDFYRDWTIVLGQTNLPPAKQIIRHDLVGSSSIIFGFTVIKHQLDLWYGKCSQPLPN